MAEDYNPEHLQTNVQEPQSRLERKGSVVNIFKLEGEYTVVYDYHTVFAASRPLDPKSIPDNLGGIFIETTTIHRTYDLNRQKHKVKLG